MSDLINFFGQNGFNTDSVEPQDDFEVIPPGKYPVCIDKAEVKETKKENGHYVKLEMTIVDGPFKNRKLWDQINIDNPSTKCVEIGLRTLSALGRAIDINVISDTDSLIGKFCLAHVKVKDEQNIIRTYSPTGVGYSTQMPPNLGGCSGITPPQQPYTGRPVQESQQTDQTQGKPPWAR